MPLFSAIDRWRRSHTVNEFSCEGLSPGDLCWLAVSFVKRGGTWVWRVPSSRVDITGPEALEVRRQFLRF